MPEPVELFEDDPEDLLPGIQIFRLRKILQCRPLVRRLTLNIFLNQITTIVGPHESGKTTLMYMLRGSMYPTDGTANIDDNDIRTDRICARRCLGVAPQCNALWRCLTVFEHIYFWTKLKTLVCSCKAEEEARYWICRFGLQAGATTPAKKLSYGMKRKLAIANAFCGGSKIILLDDPTSGLDPTTKIDVYKALKEENHNRVILITTHLINDGDFADRIVVFYKGEMVCCGSSQFLRDAFGGTYTLIIHPSKDCNPDTVTSFVRSHLPCIEMKPTPTSELRYSINQDEAAAMKGLLSDLAANGASLGIRSFNVVQTPLEDILMRPELKRHFAKRLEEEICAPDDKACNADPELCYQRLKGCRRCWNQFDAFLCKKLLYYLRGFMCLFLQILLPLLVVLLATLVPDKFDKEPKTSAEIIEVETISASTATAAPERLFDYNFIPVSANDSSLQFAAVLDATFKELINPNMTLTFLVELMGEEDLDAVPYARGKSSKPKEIFFLLKAKGLFGTTLSFAFILLLSTFIKYHIREKASCFKLMQFVNGASVCLYWFAAFVVDLLIYIVISALILLLPAILFNREGYNDFITMFLLSTIFALSALPMLYLFVHCYCGPCQGCVFLFLLGLLPLGLLLFSICNTLSTTGMGDIAKMLHAPFCLSPFYSLIAGMLGQADTSAPGKGEKSKSPYGFEYPGITANVLLWTAITPFYFYWLVAYDSHCLRGLCFRKIVCRRIKVPEILPCTDSDVYDEQKRIYKIAQPSFQKHDKVILFRNLTKNYGCFYLLSNLNVGIRKMECFGIVGVRGAGKSTIMKMLIGDSKVSCGNAWICSYDVRCNVMCARTCIGYLPQCDYGFRCLTVSETLRFYALIRAIPFCALKAVIFKLARDLYFCKYLEEKMCDLIYSIRKRVYFAIAVMSAPRVLLLDDPTAGVDPVTRYYIWKYICKLRASGMTILLTTESMEEAEALCTRVAVLHCGQFRCMGPPQYLRKKFVHDCYKLKILKCKDRPINAYIQEKIPNNCMKKNTEDVVIYEIPKGCSISDLFAIMEFAKCKGMLIEYTLVQPAFDEVFNALTAIEEEVDEDACNVCP